MPLTTERKRHLYIPGGYNVLAIRSYIIHVDCLELQYTVCTVTDYVITRDRFIQKDIT